MASSESVRRRRATACSFLFAIRYSPFAFLRKPHDPPVHPRPHPAGQDRLSDGGQRQGDHLSRARRAVEPGRASVSLARPEGRRSHRVPDGEPAGVHGDLLGGAAQRALLHRDQPLSDPGRDRLHRQGLRRARRHHLAEMRRPDQGAGHGRSRCAAVLHASTSRCPAFAPGTARAHSSRPRRSRTKSPATTCCIRRAPRAGPKASSALPSTIRSICRIRS